MLQNVGNALLRIGDALLTACCCGRDRFKACVPSEDECGNSVIVCVDSETGTPFCPPACAEPPEPCDCGPDKQCETCYECVDRKCVRIEDCCADGTPCPACSTCIDGQCVPCDEIPCTQCVGGSCSPCGPCQKCEDGECSPCDSDEECINGVCVKKKYWCCWNSCADKNNNTGNTTCKAETIPGVSPCGTGADPNASGGTCDLTKSGPYNSLQGTPPGGTGGCEPNCQRYACTPDACGINRCVKNANGQYATKAACEAACGDPCNAPCTFAGGNSPGIYSIDGCEREICVSYSSPAGRPIRVQIWGPVMIDGCPEPGSRVIKSDSGWRGFECCDCPNARNGGDLEGEPRGTITWNKPAGATHFEVAVLNPCPMPFIGVQLDVKCDDECDDLAEARCACLEVTDCGPACACCAGTCVAPCECGGIEDAIATICFEKPATEPLICPTGGGIYPPPCECQDGTQTQFYGEPPWIFGEPSTPLKPGKSLVACHKRIVYASVSYGKYLEPEPCWPHNDYSCCIKVKFKKKIYACDGDGLVDVTDDMFVSAGDCIGDPIEDCAVHAGPTFSGATANLGNCPEGTYCVKMAPNECMPCDECDAAEPDTGFFDTEPTCLPPP